MATYTINVTTTALHITDGDEVNCTAAGEFSYRQSNDKVEFSQFAGDGVVIDFGAESPDTATVNGGGSLTSAATLITALDAVVTA